MTATIALVDDDRNILTSVSIALQTEGFLTRVYSDGETALKALTDNPPDLAIFDIKMPRMDGLELLRRLRGKSQIPVIFLTSKDDELDEALGLAMGADDYIAKPFGTRELIARIRAVLRRGSLERNPGEREEGVLTFDGWQVTLPRRELTSPTGAVVDLTGAEFDLLVSLAEHAGRVIARERLIELSRTRLGDSSDRSIDVLISRLRRKLSSAGKDAPIITVRGVGYMLNTEVTRR